MNSLNNIIKIIKDIIPSKYKDCISIDQLHALQPNLHVFNALSNIFIYIFNCSIFNALFYSLSYSSRTI